MNYVNKEDYVEEKDRRYISKRTKELFKEEEQNQNQLKWS